MTKFAQKFSARAYSAMSRLLTLALFLALFGASTVLAQTRAYVANINDNTVSVIDSSTNTVIATIPYRLVLVPRSSTSRLMGHSSM